MSGDCVTDNLTGLMWMRTPPSGTYTWQNALTYANGRNAASLCGYNSGWRIPNILELESLINLGQVGSATWLKRPENGFTAIAAKKYWSSTTANSDKNMAWVIDFSDDSRDLKDKSLSSFTWPVRGETASPAQLWQTGQTGCYNASGAIVACEGTGQDGEIQAGAAWPSPRFVSSGIGAVIDNLTGLIWTTDASTPGPPVCDPGGGKISYNAYLFIRCLNDNNYLGYNDWRLPNRKELESLLDHSQSVPALPSGHPFSAASSGWYWTSDTYISLCSSGWAIDMNTGLAKDFNKNLNALPVWPVRGPLSLKVLLAGDGAGGITGDEISCNGKKCLGIYNKGEEITISADSTAHSVFSGWTGCPSPFENECTFVINTDITITATFMAAKSIWKKPDRLNFGNVGVGVVSPQKFIAIKNLKPTDLYIESVTITGTNAADFILEEDCTGFTLPPGGTCTAVLRVNAQDYGIRRAYLVAVFDDTKIPMVKMKLKAKAKPPKIRVRPKTLRFGAVNIGNSSDQQLTIENQGPTNLTISTIASSGDNWNDFIYDPSGCTVVLEQGQSCSFAITFRPGAGGKRTGALAITSDVPEKEPVVVILKGEGTLP